MHGYEGDEFHLYFVTFIWVRMVIFSLVRSTAEVSKALLYTIITRINFYSVLVYLLQNEQRDGQLQNQH